MSLTATDLLDGPRGRWLLLMVATMAQADEATRYELRSAGVALANALQPGGTVVWLSQDGSGPPPAPGVSEFAQLLRTAPLDGPRPDLFELLAGSVAVARYWQEPDADDVVAGLAELRPALERAAAVLTEDPDTAWWSTAIARADQRVVRFDDAALPASPGATGWRTRAAAEEERAARDRPPESGARFSGDWWSTPLVWDSALRSTRSLGAAGPVGLRLVEDGMGWRAARVHALHVDAAARVYELDGAEAWAALCRRFPFDVTASRRHDWYRVTGRDGRWVVPDWTAAAEEYDGVHLSVTGYLRAAGRAIPVEDDAFSVLAGWDPDATWWLRADRIRETTEPATTEPATTAAVEDWVVDGLGRWRRGMHPE